jgi:hypothetical protein
VNKQRFIGELIQWLVIALLAFAMFAWIEVRFFLPTLERDIEKVIHHDTIYHDTIYIIDGHILEV